MYMMELSMIYRRNSCSPHSNYMQQYVEEVLDYTSQYGSGGSISYTAHNIVGKPQIFPAYGDFPHAYVMRTYGKWWQMAPSGRKEICSQNFSRIKSQDYIDICFEHRVYPVQLYVYETYNPGAIVRIWAFDGISKWAVLWESVTLPVQPTSRIFSPQIKTPTFSTNILRLEFDLRQLDYYPEFDAVLMTGSIVEPLRPEDEAAPEVCQIPVGVGAIMKQVLSLKLHEFPPIHSKTGDDNNADNDTKECNFECLPYESVLKIFSYLDLKSLCQCAQVCQRFCTIAQDSSLYKEVNLRPYWSLVSLSCLESLKLRCGKLVALDISWCGNFEPQRFCHFFMRFIEVCGQRLKILRLNNCRFVNNDCLFAISKSCPNLRELSARNVNLPRQEGWRVLQELTQLEYLDFYNSSVHVTSLQVFLPKLPHLQHLNLGSCTQSPSMDYVVESLIAHCPKMVSIDLWKTYSLSAAGLRNLAKLSHLEEVELGWCGEIESPGESLKFLAQGCPKLRKLFIAALRGITDRDLIIFLEKCPLLEQVDLLGARSITPDFCLRMLSQCHNLKLLDLSFCEQILESHVLQWRAAYPQVSIKHSFSPDLDDFDP